MLTFTESDFPEVSVGKVFLVRHGEVEWNRKNAYIGSTDLPLNTNGERQAQMLADHLSGEKITAVYSSDLSRSRRTAELVAERFGLQVQIMPKLREVDYGEWEGVGLSNIAGRYPDLYEAWQNDPSNQRIPGGETFAELRDRAFPAFNDIAQRHKDENAVVVAHKSTNRVILCCILGMDVNRYKSIAQGNAALNVIAVRSDGRLVVDSVNERCFLAEAD